jgi:predicted deacylase
MYDEQEAVAAAATAAAASVEPNGSSSAFDSDPANSDAASATASAAAATRAPLSHVVITARVHPGETPASFVCQGLIDFLVSDHALARLLREHVVFVVIPMLNPDGVAIGNYRCSSMGLDLNRQWQAPAPWCEPTIAATKRLLIELSRHAAVDLDVFIDMHAHTMATVGFMYLNGDGGASRSIRNDASSSASSSSSSAAAAASSALLFPRLLDQHSADFNFAKCKQCSDPSKGGTGRRVMGAFLQRTSCFTLEVSFWLTALGGRYPKCACLGRVLFEYLFVSNIFIAFWRTDCD